MNWFRSRARSRSHAVLSPIAGGAAALRVRDDGERVHVLAFARRENLPVERGVQAVFEDMLRQLAADAEIKDAPLISLLDQESYQTVMVEAPNVPDDEIRSAIRWKVKELLSFHIDDAVLDHLPVPGGGGRAASLYVVAAQANSIRALAQPYQAAGLQLEVIDIRETAQHNLAMQFSPADYAIAVLHFDGDNALLTFSFGPSLIMSRRIEGRGASGENLLDRVAMETQRSVDYFERQYSWFPLAKLYLAPTEQAKALLRRLGEYLPIGVDNLDLTRIFDFDAQLDADAQARWRDVKTLNAAFHLLGASLRGRLP